MSFIPKVPVSRLSLLISLSVPAQRQDQLPYFYAAADICILPSRYESFGMVALEAMACGTPVIASKVGGLASFIQNERSGILIPEEDEVSLAEKILLLLTDTSFKDTLGGEARHRALEFSWPVVTQQVLSLYQDMQHGRKASAKDLINSSLNTLEEKRAALDI